MTSLAAFDAAGQCLGRDLDHHALDDAGQPRVSFSSKIAYGLYKVTDAAPDNWAKFGDLFILADNLAGEVFKQARVTAYDRVADIPAEVLAGMTLQHPLDGQGLRLRRAAARRRSCHRRHRHRLRAYRAGPWPRGLRDLDRNARAARSARHQHGDPLHRRRERRLHRSTRRASPASASSTTRARRATPTRRSSRR